MLLRTKYVGVVVVVVVVEVEVEVVVVVVAQSSQLHATALVPLHISLQPIPCLPFYSPTCSGINDLHHFVFRPGHSAQAGEKQPLSLQGKISINSSSRIPSCVR